VGWLLKGIGSDHSRGSSEIVYLRLFPCNCFDAPLAAWAGRQRHLDHDDGAHGDGHRHRDHRADGASIACWSIIRRPGCRDRGTTRRRCRRGLQPTMCSKANNRTGHRVAWERRGRHHAGEGRAEVGRSGCARRSATVRQSQPETLDSRTVAHSRTRSQQGETGMAFKRSGVRLSSAPLKFSHC
jgi:hypothetical protein